MQKSKNRLRKDKRAAFNLIMNGLARDPESAKFTRELRRLKEMYFVQIDEELTAMGVDGDLGHWSAEVSFIRNVVREILGDGWVTVRRSNGQLIQFKCSVEDYIKHRRKGARDAVLNAAAAQHLKARAVAAFHPKHP